MRLALTQEVRQDLNEEAADQRAGAPSSGPPPLFQGPFPRLLLAGAPANAWSGNREWPLAPGDVLRIAGPPAPGAAYATVELLSSRGRNGVRGTQLTVGLEDLMEMQNQMRAGLDEDLADLQVKAKEAMRDSDFVDVAFLAQRG